MEAGQKRAFAPWCLLLIQGPGTYVELRRSPGTLASGAETSYGVWADGVPMLAMCEMQGSLASIWCPAAGPIGQQLPAKIEGNIQEHQSVSRYQYDRTGRTRLATQHSTAR